MRAPWLSSIPLQLQLTQLLTVASTVSLVLPPLSPSLSPSHEHEHARFISLSPCPSSSLDLTYSFSTYKTYKDTFPGLWDVSVGGHVTAGEGSLETAIKETREELGLSCDETSFCFVCTVATTAKGSTPMHGDFLCNEYKVYMLGVWLFLHCSRLFLVPMSSL